MATSIRLTPRSSEKNRLMAASYFFLFDGLSKSNDSGISIEPA